MKKTYEVFGVSPGILPDSYVDRGDLDFELAKLLERPNHIALRGESKCGKSWLRQKNIPNALTVQCRFEKGAASIYTDALSQLEIKLVVQEHSTKRFSGHLQATGEVGMKLLAKASGEAEISADFENSKEKRAVGRDIDDLRFIADLIKISGKRLIVEDFHYLSIKERKDFAFDLKTLWDYGLPVVMIGVWSRSNMLIYLNPDLAGRISELSIYWSEQDLSRVLEKGGAALNIKFSKNLIEKYVRNCFGNVGILQTLALGALDAAQITQTEKAVLQIEDQGYFESAAMSYSDQLDALYQKFASRVSNGIRRRSDSTGIYAHTMAVIMSATDDELIKGLGIDQIYERAHERQNRIQKANLRSVLEKFEELQVDDGGRGLVLGYNEGNSEITVVDRQLLMYRKYCTVNWPWEQLASEQTPHL